jgi:ectoine hydroxylase-related dioxygenase (phytanoyl-CoA dioxygenase family)
MNAATSTHTIEEDGFLWIRRLVGPEQIVELINSLAALDTESTRAGVRDLLSRCPTVAKFAASKSVTQLIQPILGASPFVVRGILFDKTPDANWRVAWHQDVTITVREQCPVSNFGPWSIKDGVPHTHAPTNLLEKMVTLRLHLDDCDDMNGALRVIPGSHRRGKLDTKAIDEWKNIGEVEVCAARAGDALLMRPLLLHASSPANTPKHRRVIHLEFAADELPAGLAWAERISA